MIKATIKKVASFLLVMLMMLSVGTTVSAQNTLYGDNLVVDGDFEGDTLSASWGFDATSPANLEITGGEAAITGFSGSGNSWDVQLFQELTDEQIATLARGGNWELTFDARTSTDSTKTLHVFLGNNEIGGDWARYWSDNYTFTTDTTITLTTDIPQTWPLMKLAFEVNHDAQDIFIDNVVLRRVEDNILLNGSFSGDSLGAWAPDINNGAEATVGVIDGELAITNINSPNSTTFHVQAFQDFNQEQIDSIYAGPYEIIFEARSDEEKTFVVYFGENIIDGSWTNFGGEITVGTEMQTYTMAAEATQNFAQMKFGFEVGSTNSSVYFDNVIVRRVREFAPEPPTFSLSTADGVVTITADAQDNTASYEVFFSDTAFTSVEGGVQVGTIGVDGDLTLTHTTQAPHSSLATTFTGYYGVIARTESGTPSEITVSSIETGMTVLPNYIFEFETDDAGAVLDAVDTGEFPSAETIAGYFPADYEPFAINSERKSIENGSGGDSDEDISGKIWVGFENDTGQDFMIIYAEITDDIIVPAPSSAGGSGAWNYDSWEIGIGAYSPESFITGSNHQAFEIGAEPDYQFRAGFFSDAAPFISAWDGGAGLYDQLVPNSATIGDSSQAGMYRLLTIVSTIQFSTVNTESVNFDFPTGAEVSTVPFQFALNDNDVTARDTQISWSSKAGQDDWWNTPARWETVAMVGQSAVSNEEDPSLDNPFTFSLQQNYPNPFNPSTNIEFTLGATSNVTLEVYNLLGQKVATILEGERLAAGAHLQQFDASSLASGMYLYKISADNFTQTRKMMLIK